VSIIKQQLDKIIEIVISKGYSTFDFFFFGGGEGETIRNMEYVSLLSCISESAFINQVQVREIQHIKCPNTPLISKNSTILNNLCL